MKSKSENMNKEVANSLNKYTGAISKGTNIVLDGANQVNKWYKENLNKISEGEVLKDRIETNVDVILEEKANVDNKTSEKIQTKIENYNELKINIEPNKRVNKVKTQLNENGVSEKSKISKATEKHKLEFTKKTNRIPKYISSTIKVLKSVNRVADKAIKAGKSINNGLDEGEVKSFENSSRRIMTKPIRKVGSKVTRKATKKISSTGRKVVKGIGTKAVQQTTNAVMKIIQLLAKLVINVAKMIISMLPQIAPVIIIILIIVCFCSYFGIGMSEETKAQYENYMISVQNEYDKITVAFYNKGKIVDGAIEGKGMIDWKASLSIIQMLNGELLFDEAEIELLNTFKNAGLFETITNVSYTYEKEIVETDEEGNEINKTETITEIKKVVNNPTLEDYLNWCNSNFNVINRYKEKKNLTFDLEQKAFTDSEVEQIKLLYGSNTFFELFSSDFKSNYAYAYLDIGDEQLQAIYDEFLKNAGKRYLMDHSNLSYNTCMNYYDCSSWVIHCLAHTGIKIIPNTNAEGIYKNHCYPININDRKAGDLIFLKDTYNTGVLGSISHIGIYMGELTINGETAEWVIDTGGNPSGVRIRKYNNGWWNGNNFYGFARLK